MLKFAETLPKLSYYESLKTKPVDFIKKKVFVNDMFKPNSYRWCRFPCLTLNVVNLNNCDFEKEYEFNHYNKAYLQDRNVIPVWTRSFWGKRAWKSTLINTHREPIHAIMSLFGKKHHFYDLKMNYTSYQRNKLHFSAQLLMAMKCLNAFDDENMLKVPFGKKKVKKLPIYDFQERFDGPEDDLKLESFKKFLLEDIYDYNPQHATALTQEYL
jgi:hypothetical protein